MRQKIVINGKRISGNKYEVLLQDAVENVVLEGFFDTEDLSKLVAINGYNYQYIIDGILDRLLSLYSRTIERLRKTSSYDKAAAANVVTLSEKEKIVLDLIKKRSAGTIKTISDNESEYFDYDDIDKFEDDIIDDEPNIKSIKVM